MKFIWMNKKTDYYIFNLAMDRIFNKIKLQSYKSFKEFMDEMVDMFSRFRDYYHDAQIHSREVGLQRCFSLKLKTIILVKMLRNC